MNSSEVCVEENSFFRLEFAGDVEGTGVFLTLLLQKSQSKFWRDTSGGKNICELLYETI